MPDASFNAGTATATGVAQTIPKRFYVPWLTTIRGRAFDAFLNVDPVAVATAGAATGAANNAGVMKGVFARGAVTATATGGANDSKPALLRLGEDFAWIRAHGTAFNARVTQT